MTITISSTDRVVEIETDDGRAKVPARVWEGKTESGIPVFCLVNTDKRTCGRRSDGVRA